MRFLRRWWRKVRFWLTGRRTLTATYTFETAEELREIYGFNDPSLVDRMVQAIREETDESATNAMYFEQAWRESMPNYHGRL